MKIDWDTQNGKLTVEFTYAYVSGRCTDEKLNKWESSSKIVDDAIRIFLKGTDIRWTNGSCFEKGQVLILEKSFGDKAYKDISIKKLNSILFEMDEYISNEIYNLINPK